MIYHVPLRLIRALTCRWPLAAMDPEDSVEKFHQEDSFDDKDPMTATPKSRKWRRMMRRSRSSNRGSSNNAAASSTCINGRSESGGVAPTTGERNIGGGHACRSGCWRSARTARTARTALRERESIATPSRHGIFGTNREGANHTADGELPRLAHPPRPTLVETCCIVLGVS